MVNPLLQRLQVVLAARASKNVGDSQENSEQKLCPPTGAGRQAAVLLAITDEDAPRLLLIRRSLNLPIHPGEIALPGGKRDRDDKDLCATALREAWEEVALPQASVNCIGVLEPRISQTELAVTPVVGIISPDIPLRAHAGEVAEILYVPLAHFADRKHLRADRIMWKGETRTTARFQFEHYTIWGLTGSFIVELINCLYDAGLNVEMRAERALMGVRT